MSSPGYYINKRKKTDYTLVIYFWISCSCANFSNIDVSFHLKYEVPEWDKGSIRYFDIFHDQSIGSILSFRKPDKIL